MRGSRRRAERYPSIGCGATLLASLLVLGLTVPAAGQTAATPTAAFRLEQNFPNPFTPGVSPTIFTYALEGDAEVRLTIYNLLAQEVAILVDERQKRGLHRVAWDGTDGKGEFVPAGVYWYKLQADQRSALRRLRVRDRSEAG